MSAALPQCARRSPKKGFEKGARPVIPHAKGSGSFLEPEKRKRPDRFARA